VKEKENKERKGERKKSGGERRRKMKRR